MLLLQGLSHGHYTYYYNYDGSNSSYDHLEYIKDHLNNVAYKFHYVYDSNYVDYVVDYLQTGRERPCGSHYAAARSRRGFQCKKQRGPFHSADMPEDLRLRFLGFGTAEKAGRKIGAVASDAKKY